MKTLKAVWKRGGKRVVRRAAETVVCDQGSGCLRQSEYGGCSWITPRKVGSKHNSVPCLAKAGCPLAWPPEGQRGNGNLERTESFLIEFLSLQNTCCRFTLESKRTCKTHRPLEPNTDDQNLLGSCLGYLTNVLDESYAQSRLITTCWDDKIWWQEPFVYRLPKALSWSQHLESSCLDPQTDPQIKRSQVPSWWEITPWSLHIPTLKVKPHPLATHSFRGHCVIFCGQAQRHQYSLHQSSFQIPE